MALVYATPDILHRGLRCSVLSGDRGIMALMLELKADVNALYDPMPPSSWRKEYGPRSPLELSISNMEDEPYGLDTARLLVSAKADVQQALPRAVRSGFPTVVKLLLKQKAVVDRPGQPMACIGRRLGAYSLLGYALTAVSSSSAISSLLLRHKASLGSMELDGNMTKEVETLNCPTKLAQLLQLKASANGPHFGRSPLIAALVNRRQVNVKLLLRAKAMVNADGSTQCCNIPLVSALEDLVSVEALLRFKADATVTYTRDNKSLLHNFTVSAKVAKLLLEAKADVNARNSDGYTPVDIHQYDGYTSCLFVLQTYGGKGTPVITDPNV